MQNEGAVPLTVQRDAILHLGRMKIGLEDLTAAASTPLADDTKFRPRRNSRCKHATSRELSL